MNQMIETTENEWLEVNRLRRDEAGRRAEVWFEFPDREAFVQHWTEFVLVDKSGNGDRLVGVVRDPESGGYAMQVRTR